MIVRQDVQVAQEPVEAVRQRLKDIEFPQTADVRRMVAVVKEYEQ